LAKPLLPDSLWSRIEPMLPPPPLRKGPGGRPRVPDRACLTGILFVLKTGIPWEDLPREMGCGCGMTCWRRMHEWSQAGVWGSVLAMLLRELDERGGIDWSRALVDSSSLRAVGGGEKHGPEPD